MTKGRDDLFSKALLTLAIGALGGWVFYLVGSPLPWMLGSLAFTLIGALSHGKTHIPRQARNIAVPVLGVLIGSRFTVELAEQARQWIAVYGLTAVFLVCATLLGMVYFRRVQGQDPVTAFCSSVPAGISELIMIAPGMGADIRAVVLAHLARVIVVVFTIPFAFRLWAGELEISTTIIGTASALTDPGEMAILLACGVLGLFFAKRLRFPAAPLTGPILFSAIAHLSDLSHIAPPTVLVAAVQVVIGATIGVRFVGISLRGAGRKFLGGIGWAVVLLLMSLAFAVVGSRLLGIDIGLLVLGMAPGGVQEMTLISLSLGLEVAFVSTVHIVRIIMVLGVGLPLFQWIYGDRGLNKQRNA